MLAYSSGNVPACASTARANVAPPWIASWISSRIFRPAGSSTCGATDFSAPASGTPAPASVASCRVKSGRNSCLPSREGSDTPLPPPASSESFSGNTPSACSFLRAREGFSASTVPRTVRPALEIPL